MASSRKPWPDRPVGARRQWGADRALRPAMRSPGRPEPSRAVQRAFWRLIAQGLTSEDAGAEVGVSTPVAARWFRHAGRMPPISLAEPAGRYLSFAEREEISLLKAQDHGVREIARALGRDPSTISRELRRNAATRAGQRGYRAGVAQGRHSRPRSVRSRRSWPRTRGCAPTSSTSWRGQSPTTRDVRSRARTCPGQGVATGVARTGVGAWRGARNRSATGSRSTSHMMSLCGSPTRRSTSLSTSRAAVRCVGS